MCNLNFPWYSFIPFPCGRCWSLKRDQHLMPPWGSCRLWWDHPSAFSPPTEQAKWPKSLLVSAVPEAFTIWKLSYSLMSCFYTEVPKTTHNIWAEVAPVQLERGIINSLSWLAMLYLIYPRTWLNFLTHAQLLTHIQFAISPDLFPLAALLCITRSALFQVEVLALFPFKFHVICCYPALQSFQISLKGIPTLEGIYSSF